MAAELPRFDNRVALVTGTGKENGIGWATAKLLGQNGAWVAAAVRTAEDIPLVEQRIKEAGFDGMGIEIDYTNYEGYESFSAKAEDRLLAIASGAGGPIGDIVHCAGDTRDEVAVKTTESDWDAVHWIKDKGPFFLTTAAMPQNLRKAKPGRVVGVASVVGPVMGNKGQTKYGSANGGMVGWIRSLAAEYEGKDIYVNAFAPGLVETNLTRGELTQEQWDALESQVPLGRAYQADEVAERIVDLLASGKNGHLEIMDGGMSVNALAERFIVL